MTSVIILTACKSMIGEPSVKWMAAMYACIDVDGQMILFVLKMIDKFFLCILSCAADHPYHSRTQSLGTRQKLIGA